jgi:uncharacterized protein Veg
MKNKQAVIIHRHYRAKIKKIKAKCRQIVIKANTFRSYKRKFENERKKVLSISGLLRDAYNAALLNKSAQDKHFKTRKMIFQQIVAAIVKLGGKSDLLSIVGSYGDTLTNKEILQQLREWNRKNKKQ